MWRDFIVTAVFIALAACQGGGPVRQPPAAPAAEAATEPDGAIMLVFFREFSPAPRTEDIANENLMIGCLGEEIQRNRPKQRLVSFADFHRTAFPNLPLSSAPRHPAYLPILFRHADFRELIRPLGIRHVAFISGVTKSIPSGGIGCLGAGPGFGCFGMITWDMTSRLGASVLDLKDLRQVNTLTASSSATSWFSIVGIFPIGMPSNTAGAACQDLGSRLAHYLDNDALRSP